MSRAGTAAPPSREELRQLALTEEEYGSACRQLGREPNQLELGLLGALWSEHCSYKTSKRLLGQLPSASPRVVQGPGENAGVVDLGGGLLCCFKMESHNHPSAVEPVQGAATGVGGILRDVIAMGARPVALLDSIRFGALEDARQRQRFARVVEGIGWYGNCIGVPTVGGETYFDQAYSENCLVNAMCVGLVEQGRLARALARGEGNPVLLVGADTGRDGIHGATFASVELDREAEERRPAVQVGNPFLEKCLLEACQELAGDPDLVGLQDCGAAGLSSACAEMAHRGGSGVEIEVQRVSRRERGMGPYEVMLSESQERMVLVVREGAEERFRERFRRWGLRCDVIGRVIAEPCLRVTDGGRPVAQLPLSVLVAGVPPRRPQSRAEPAPAASSPDPLLEVPPWPAEEAWLRVLGSPNCASSRWVWRQYDHQVGDDTIVGPGADAAVLRLRGRVQGLALSVDSAHPSARLDPRRGTAMGLAEGLRNLACVGAEPLGVTDCLNFGDPDSPLVMWQLEEAVAGLAEAARELGVPVVSGNVSLHNQYQGRSIPPTPSLGLVGLVPDLERLPRPGFCVEGDLVALLGRPGAGPEGVELGGSEYQRLASGQPSGSAPELDLAAERRAAEAVRQAVRARLLRSCHDCSLGGLGVALAEAAVWGGQGAVVRSPLAPPERPSPGWAAAVLLGETQGRYLASLDPGRLAELERALAAAGVPLAVLGRVGGEWLEVSGVARIPLAGARERLEGALPGAMAGPALGAGMGERAGPVS